MTDKGRELADIIERMKVNIFSVLQYQMHKEVRPGALELNSNCSTVVSKGGQME